MPPTIAATPVVAPIASVAKVRAKLLTSTERLARDEYPWPPEKGGPWLAFERPWMHTIPGAPPTFYVTTVRPDPARKVTVQVVAIDARQIELEMAIGNEGPYPPDEKTKGKWPRSGGKLPRTPAVAEHVVAAFNGAFRLDQNAHGMTIQRRVFAPTVTDMATLWMHDDGRLGFGTLAASITTPPDIRSLRQNLEPLLDGELVNPKKRPRWGGIIKGANQVGQRAKRSGLCRTAAGQLLYLWGDAIEALDLGNSMKMVDCDYGLHLDMNAPHVGFVFMSFSDAQYKSGKSEALAPNMGVTAKKYSQQPNPKEFFYATLRAPFAGPDASFVADGGVQPAPSWFPAVLAGDHVTLFDRKRVRFAITEGEASLPPEDAGRVLAAIEITGVRIVDGALDLGEAGAGSTAIGVNARGDLVVVEGTNAVERAIAAGCARAVGAGRFERAGRDEIVNGGEHARLYVIGVDALPVTHRFDRP